MGSATTAHAVMQLNAENARGNNRKYIMVQLPEIIKEDKIAYKEGYRTIDEIGRERIRRAAKKIKEQTNTNIDYGFKTFKLESLSDTQLASLEEFNPNKLIIDDMVSLFKGKQSILATYLLKDGYGLSRDTKEYILDTYKADIIDNSLYIIEQGLTSNDVMVLIKKIENIELDINRIIVYSYSLAFNVLQELRTNLKNLRNNKNVELIERY